MNGYECIDVIVVLLPKHRGVVWLATTLEPEETRFGARWQTVWPGESSV